MSVPYYGSGPLGFIPKPLDACLQELEDLARSVFGNGINLAPSSKWSQFLGILADRYADLWDSAQESESQRDPDQATGANLEAISAYTGTVRHAERRSTVLGTLVGDPGTLIASYSQLAIDGGATFRTTATATLAAVAAWVGAADTTLGARCTNGGNVYEAIAAGTTGATGGPTGTGTNISDGSVHWRYLAAGTAAADVLCESVAAGAFSCPARTLTTIKTPVVGWRGCSNALAAELGGTVETDGELRIRRESELALSGSSTLDAIRAEVLDVSGVTSCAVFENVTDTTNSDGVPPHAIETLISGDLAIDADVLAAVFRSKAAGIQAYGTTTGMVADSTGTMHAMAFSRATLRNLYIVVELDVDVMHFPSGGADAAKAQIVAAADAAFALGVDVTAWILKKAISLIGLIDVPHLYIGWSASPTSETRLPVSGRQRAVADASRIVVNIVPTSP